MGVERACASAPASLSVGECSNWVLDVKCWKEAAYWMVTPDLELCPGGPVCEDCALSMMSEYLEKLGELWSVEPLRIVE